MSYSERNNFISSPSICNVQLPLANKKTLVLGPLYLELGFDITMTVQKRSFMNGCL